nr:ATP-binding cassette domain-containing protein [Desulfovibrio sp.]
MAKTAPRDKAGDAPLILERLAYAYPESPESPILRDINLELRDGERIGLTGANGSGKTTLFRCITGLSRPAGGALFLESRRIVSEKDFQYLRRRVGYVLQNSDDQLIFPTVME